MRFLVFTLTLIAAVLLLAACASTGQSPSSTANANLAPSAPQSTRTANTAPASTESAPPVAVAHGGGGAPQSAAPSAATADEPTGIDTSAMDAKIANAEEKAKAKNATPADKLAAAAAYMERADIFMNAGRPTLYKYALRDYRRTLRYQPDNEQARKSMNTIVSIYQSMGRPVPELGNEP